LVSRHENHSWTVLCSGAPAIRFSFTAGMKPTHEYVH
jgi:hypothetical protein